MLHCDALPRRRCSLERRADYNTNHQNLNLSFSFRCVLLTSPQRVALIGRLNALAHNLRCPMTALIIRLLASRQLLPPPQLETYDRPSDCDFAGTLAAF